VERGGPGIKVGTAISTLLKAKAGQESGPRIFTRDFWGQAELKRRALLSSLDIETWDTGRRGAAAKRPEGPRPYEEFGTSEDNAWRLAPRGAGSAFEDWPALDELFPTSYQGVNPNRGLDGSLIDIERGALEGRMKDYFSKMSFEDLARKHPVLCERRARYEPKALREQLLRLTLFEGGRKVPYGFQKDHIVPYMVFPLDQRWIYYETEGKLLNERRQELWDNLADNEFLIAVPLPRRRSESRPLFAKGLFDLHLHDRGSVGFPATVGSGGGDLFHKSRANLQEASWVLLAKAWGLKGGLDGEPANKTVRQLFSAVLALGHAPQYETDNAEGLAQDWAHVPIPRGRDALERVVRLGGQLATLLDASATPNVRRMLGASASSLGVLSKVGGGSIKGDALTVERSYYGASVGDWRPKKITAKESMHPAWGERTGDLHINEQVFFAHVPEGVWRYELGGYPVLKKWLGYREARRRADRPLTLAEAEYFREMVQRIAAVLSLRDELDEAYERVGADAFTADDLALR
jgi:hypothetical protein